MNKIIHPLILKLKDIRKEQHLSQLGLVGKSDYRFGQTQISGWEVGSISPTLKGLSTWAETLGYELALRRIEEK